MEERIIYSNADGAVCVIIPAPDSGLTIGEIAAKDVPQGAAFEIVTVADIPADRTFRSAWRKNASAVAVDMPAARELWRDKIRAARVDAFAANDAAFVKATMEGADTSAIVAKAQALRDAPADNRIEAAKTPEQLMAVKPAGLDPK